MNANEIFLIHSERVLLIPCFEINLMIVRF